MVIPVLLAGPDKTVVIEKSKVVGNIDIRFVFFVKHHLCFGLIDMIKKQLQIILVTVKHLCAENIRIIRPFDPGNIIGVLQTYLLRIPAFEIIDKRETSALDSPALGYLNSCCTGYKALPYTSMENSGTLLSSNRM